MPTNFRAPQQPQREALQKSYLILKYAHDTAESFLDAFDKVRRARNAGRGATRDEEQDLLRAMVVFAGAGIDAMTKQLIRDALPVMVSALPNARARIERLGARHLRRGGAEAADDDAGALAAVNPQRLAKVLLADNPRSGLVELLVDDLTAGSLQSVDELYRVLSYLGLEPKALDANEAALRKVFDCRNRLIHEMDIDFDQPNRNRFSRRKDDMVEYAGTLLGAANSILNGVDEQLGGSRRVARRRAGTRSESAVS